MKKLIVIEDMLIDGDHVTAGSIINLEDDKKLAAVLNSGRAKICPDDYYFPATEFSDDPDADDETVDKTIPDPIAATGSKNADKTGNKTGGKGKK